MRCVAGSEKYICAGCRRARISRIVRPTFADHRHFSRPSLQRLPNGGASNKPAHQDGGSGAAEQEKGAMSHRLEQMSQDSLESGGRGARKAVEEAGFDETLRKQLEERIAGASLRNEHPSAFAQAELSASAGKGTKEIAGAQPWTGTERVEDAALRMLTDAHKPIRGPPKIPSPRGPPPRVDTGRSRSKGSSGARIANARDQTSIYSIMKDSSMSEEEREKFRAQMKGKFQPGARAVPATIQGLASLANERIEDAISRGQFKNLPRGKKIERDYTASSPFLDTTEYFMNKIIQKQEIVPPWIEKQQELVATATRFRARLRSEWKRHAARLIASKGGGLEQQVRRAEAYAAAEAVVNPVKRREEKINTVAAVGHMSQISLSGELQEGSPSAEGHGSKDTQTITVTETPISSDGSSSTAQPKDQAQVTITQDTLPDSSNLPSLQPVAPAPQPFRDPTWEQVEHSYLSLSINNLNSMTRSYNLMAPDLAKKPYFNLERELRACYAEVAPQLPMEIQHRATAARMKLDVVGQSGGMLGATFGAGEKVRVRDERKGRQYGWREFWRDLFRKEGA